MSVSRPALLFPWRCPSCSRHAFPSRSLPIRTFTTTSKRPSTHDPQISTSSANPEGLAHPTHAQTAPSIGTKPESPRYIRIPQSLQPSIEKSVWVKGRLPKPRDIFHKSRGGLSRGSPNVVNRMYPERRKPKGEATGAQEEINRYKARMADMRRQNLREGMMALARRQGKRIARSKERYDKALAERKELLNAPLSEDDRLTRMSQTKEMLAPLQRQGQYMADPNAQERRRAKVERYEAQRAAKAAETQDALHTLFMRARDFIVTEEQLDREIEEAFGTVDAPVKWGSNSPSVWANGPPPSLQSKLEATGQMSGGELKQEDIRARARLTQERLKKVAETLTGGKM